MKCDNCDHQRVCVYWVNYISKLKQEDIEIIIDKCKEFDEVK